MLPKSLGTLCRHIRTRESRNNIRACARGGSSTFLAAPDRVRRRSGVASKTSAPAYSGKTRVKRGGCENVGHSHKIEYSTRAQGKRIHRSCSVLPLLGPCLLWEIPAGGTGR